MDGAQKYLEINIMAKEQKVLITEKDHPHFGETGIIKVNSRGKVVLTKMPSGSKMFEIKLENCKHASEGCFVKQADVQLI